MDTIGEYKKLRSAWIAARGMVGTSKATGAQLPRMIAGDALAVLGPLTAGVIRFHERRQILKDGVPQWMPFYIHPLLAGVTPAMPTLTNYLMRGIPDPKEPRKRRMTVPPFGGETEIWPAMPTALIEEAQKQLVGHWQAAVNAASNVLRIAPITRSLTRDEVEAIWSKLYALATMMDVAGEAPVESDWEMIKNAARAGAVASQESLERAAEIAGRAAAEIAETAGRVAGGAAGGFFEQAGVTALIVAGVAMYVALS